MLASELAARLSLFARFCNKRALSPVYRCVALSSRAVRAVSSLGALEVDVDLGSLGDRRVYVVGENFVNILRTLPAEELALRVGDTLDWSCGRARGSIDLRTLDDFPPFEWPARSPTFEVGDGFARGLKLGMLKPIGLSLRTLGLGGVVLDNRGPELWAYSTDVDTISAARLCARVPDSAAVATLVPESVPLLARVAQKPYAALAFDHRHLYCQALHTRLILNQTEPLGGDVSRVAAATSNSIRVNIRLNKDASSALSNGLLCWRSTTSSPLSL
jgi:hypothetical protein